MFNKGDIIKVRVFGKVEEFEALGNGAYPYPCPSQDRYPNAMIFENPIHSWISENRLVALGDGTYKIKTLPA